MVKPIAWTALVTWWRVTPLLQLFSRCIAMPEGDLNLNLQNGQDRTLAQCASETVCCWQMINFKKYMALNRRKKERQWMVLTSSKPCADLKFRSQIEQKLGAKLMGQGLFSSDPSTMWRLLSSSSLPSLKASDRPATGSLACLREFKCYIIVIIHFKLTTWQNKKEIIASGLVLTHIL